MYVFVSFDVDGLVVAIDEVICSRGCRFEKGILPQEKSDGGNCFLSQVMELDEEGLRLGLWLLCFIPIGL